jgi:hypothetical protein
MNDSDIFYYVIGKYRHFVGASTENILTYLDTSSSNLIRYLLFEFTKNGKLHVLINRLQKGSWE